MTSIVSGTVSAAQATVKVAPPWISGVFVSAIVMLVLTGRRQWREGRAKSAQPRAMSEGGGRDSALRSGEGPPIVLLSSSSRGGRAEADPP